MWHANRAQQKQWFPSSSPCQPSFFVLFFFHSRMRETSQLRWRHRHLVAMLRNQMCAIVMPTFTSREFWVEIWFISHQGNTSVPVSLLNKGKKDSGSVSVFSYQSITGSATTKPTNAIICSWYFFFIQSMFLFPDKQSSIVYFQKCGICQYNQLSYVYNTSQYLKGTFLQWSHIMSWSVKFLFPGRLSSPVLPPAKLGFNSHNISSMTNCT